MLKEILKVLFLLVLLCLCKSLFGFHAQVKYCIKVDYYIVKHHSGPSLTESMGAYISP